MIQSASSRRFTFISLWLFCFFVLAGCAAQIFAQTNDGKIMVPIFNDDGPATIHYVTPENSKAIGINSSGVPAMLPVGGSSTLGGLSDVAISGLANLDVLRYNSATSKWQNIPGSTFALASSLSDYLTSATAASTYAPLAHNQAWSTITSTPTTLAGYGISDAITATAAANAFQPLDDDLTSIAALATTSTGRSLLAAADAAALRSILAVSDIGVHTFGGQRQILTSPASSGTSATSSSISAVLDFLTGSGLAAPQGSIIYKGATGWGLRSIGTNGQVLSSNGTQPVWSDPASSGIGGTVGTTDNAIVRADGTGGSTAQGSVATITDAGAPTFYDSLTLRKTGTVDGVTFEAVEDPLNPTVRALFILPPQNSSRIYFGKSGQSAYSLNLLNVAVIENMPSFSVGAGLRVGAVENCYIARVGGTEIGANHPDGNGFDVFQDDSYNTATIAHRALNVHRSRGLTLFSTSTSRTNFEGLNLAWNGVNYEVKPVAGSAGGTVRSARYFTTESSWFGSGSGSPEGVEVGGVGSLYTDTATGVVYRKTSGTGNTGWVTP